MGPRDQSLGPFVRLKCNASVIQMSESLLRWRINFLRARHVIAFSVLIGVLVSGFPAAFAAEEPYRIQPGDVLGISVWREADLQAEVLVRPDGGISFPLAGELGASGKTTDEIRAALDERLRKFVPDPVITVTVRQIGGNRIYVLGKVARPGEFPFSRPLDVMQALSLAGGATSF